MERFKGNNRILIVLCLLLVFGIAYAFLSTELSFNGKTRILNNTWDIHLENIVPTSDFAKESVPVIVEDSGNLNISFDALLSTPGDVYSFSVDVVNNGSIDAMIESFSTLPVNVPNYLNYSVTWDNGNTPKENDLLPKKDGMLTLNVLLEFRRDIESDDLISDSIETNMEINIKYIQADDKASDVKIIKNFAEDDWDTILENVKKNPRYYELGATKDINVGKFGTFKVRVSNNTTPDECKESDFSKTACGFVVEFVDIISLNKMNEENTNTGSWDQSGLREYLNNEIYNSMSDDVKDVIADTTVISGHGVGDSNNTSSNDKLYLLSAVEVSSNSSGVEFDSSSDKSRLLDYYKDNSSLIKKYSGTATEWWLRSASSNYNDSFFSINSEGVLGDSYANLEKGVSPAFRIA